MSPALQTATPGSAKSFGLVVVNYLAKFRPGGLRQMLQRDGLKGRELACRLKILRCGSQSADEQLARTGAIGSGSGHIVESSRRQPIFRMGQNVRVGTGDPSARESVPAHAVSSLTAGRLFRHEWRYPPLKFMNSITPERVDFTWWRRANLRRYTWSFIISSAAETWELLPGTRLARLYFPRRCGKEMSLRER